MYLWSSLKRVPMVWQTSQPPAVASSTLSQELMARMRPNAGALRFPTLTLVFYFVSPGTFFIFLPLSITCQLWGSELELWLHFMLPLIIVVANIVTAEKKPPEKWPFLNSSARKHLTPGLQSKIGGGEKQFPIICVQTRTLQVNKKL